MSEIRKVSASAGAEWLLGGFALLRKAPLGLGLLGLIYGALALLVSLSVERNMTLFVVLELALILAGPLLLGGLVHAARSVDQGGKAEPGQLLEGARSGRAARLLATLMPQIVALIVCAVLLILMVGSDQLVQMAQTLERMQGQSTPDPALVSSLPIGRLMLWLLLVFMIGLVTSFFTFVAVPEIMFTQSGAFAAMQRSFRACVRNLPALIVFFVLTVIAVVVLYIAIMIVAVIVKLIAGAMAMQIVIQLLAMAVFMPLVTGAMYYAWKQMLGDGQTAIAEPSAGFEA
ncbi:MAG TPA: BPSS1780 family membrane protein [Luteimonas sp.]|nr:BPSS1780 family membrane protein [Luteimonas sp.]